MKKFMVIAAIVISLVCGYMAGADTDVSAALSAPEKPMVVTVESEPEIITETVTEYVTQYVEHEVVDVITSDAGVQIVYEDGTGYWWEY